MLVAVVVEESAIVGLVERAVVGMGRQMVPLAATDQPTGELGVVPVAMSTKAPQDKAATVVLES